MNKNKKEKTSKESNYNDLLLLRILSILQRYSNKDHPLGQRDIQEHLKYNYFENDETLVPTRKTVRSKVELLEQFYGSKIVRVSSPNREDYTLGWYYSDAEVSRHTIDKIVDNLQINLKDPLSENETDEMIQTLYSMIGDKNRSNHNINDIYHRKKPVTTNAYNNKNLLIQVIENNRRNRKEPLEQVVSINIVHYCFEDNKVTLSIRDGWHLGYTKVLPLKIVENEGRDYLLGYNYRSEDLVFINLTYIKSIRVKKTIKKDDEKRDKLIRNISSSDNLEKYLREQVYLEHNDLINFYENKTITAKLKLKEDRQRVYNYFFDKVDVKQVEILDDKEGLIKVRLAYRALLRLLKDNHPYIEVVAPEILKLDFYYLMKKSSEKLINDFERYNKELGDRAIMLREVNENQKWYGLNYGGHALRNKYHPFGMLYFNGKFENFLLKKGFIREDFIAQNYKSFIYVSDKYNLKQIKELIEKYAITEEVSAGVVTISEYILNDEGEYTFKIIEKIDLKRIK